MHIFAPPPGLKFLRPTTGSQRAISGLLEDPRVLRGMSTRLVRTFSVSDEARVFGRCPKHTTTGWLQDLGRRMEDCAGALGNRMGVRGRWRTVGTYGGRRCVASFEYNCFFGVVAGRTLLVARQQKLLSYTAIRQHQHEQTIDHDEHRCRCSSRRL